MATEKKEVYKVGTMTEGKRNLIASLLSEYDIQTADDIQDAHRSPIIVMVQRQNV